VRIGDAVGTFKRGMLTELAVTLDEWYLVAEAAVREWPVEWVTVPQVPGLGFWIDPPGDTSPRRLNAALQTPIWASDSPFSPAAREFESRAALASAASRSSAALVADVRDAAGVAHWPDPLTKWPV